MRLICIFIILSLGCDFSVGQNLVGKNEKEIRQYMQSGMKDMRISNVVNNSFSYLKYSDDDDNQTILFFLTPEQICKSMRIIFSTSMKEEKRKELNEKYSRTGEDTWLDEQKGEKFIVKFIEEEWSCTITIEPEKKKVKSGSN